MSTLFNKIILACGVFTYSIAISSSELNNKVNITLDKAIAVHKIEAQQNFLQNVMQSILGSKFSNSIHKAQHSIEINDFNLALAYFEQALQYAGKSAAKQRIALFGIGKVQISLEQYPNAEHTFKELLNQKLNETDEQIALDGLVRAINYQDRPKEAYSLIPPHFNYTNPSLVIAVAQAYIAAEMPNAAEELITNQNQLLLTINKNSFLEKQLKQVKEKIALQKNVQPMNAQERLLKLSYPKVVIKNAFSPLEMFSAFINNANDAIRRNNPHLALTYFEQALQKAGEDPAKQRVALFGIGKMQLWLEKYKLAELTFKKLLLQNLDGTDKQVALDGLVRAINYQDRPKEAYGVIPFHFNYTNPSLVIAVAQAYIAAEMPKTAEELITDQNQLLLTINKNSFLENQLVQLKQKIALQKKIQLIKARQLLLKLAHPKIRTESQNAFSRLEMFSVFINNANDAIRRNKPNLALTYFEQALQKAGENPAKQRVALFGIGKMQLWLEKYKPAELTFKKLLLQNLDATDKQIALDGLVRAINYQDRPKEAYSVIPPHFNYTNPSLVIAVAQAYIAAEMPKAAEELITHQNQLLLTINKNSFLENQLIQLRKKIVLLQKKRSSVKKVPTMEQLIMRAYIESGKQAFEKGKMYWALYYYANAYLLAETDDDKRTILFHVGVAFLAGEKYKDSLVIYRLLLTMPLNASDHEIALNGYVRSLSSLDRPMKAYKTIPPCFNYRFATTVVGAAQAALWAGWPYKSVYLINSYQNLLEKIPLKNYLMRQLQDILWQANFDTAPNAINYNNYFEKDSEQFMTQRHQWMYSHRFNPLFNVSLFGNRNHYSQPDFTSVRAIIAGIQSEGWVGDYFTYLTNVAQGKYNNWSPLLWRARLTYKPNDYISLSVINHREAVETMPSLLNKITLTSTEYNAVLNPFYRLILMGTAYRDRFSNNNLRRGYFGNVSFLVIPHLGIYTDYFARYYTNTIPNNRLYFSPAKYFEERLSVRLYTKLLGSRWRYYFTWGVYGRQRIANGKLIPTHNIRTGIRGPIKNNFVFDAFFGYSTAAGDNTIQASTYSRGYGGVSLTYLFK